MSLLVQSFTYIVLLYACVVWQPTTSHKHFQQSIPNGDKVTHPCLQSQSWDGVGHYNRGGGGTRNAFGVDFKAANFIWSDELCRKDSDGDGLSNGQELGDSECVWKVGTTPSRLEDITHPGVCEPVTSPHCQARNVEFGNFCKAEKPGCEANGVNETVETLVLKFNRTKIPSTVTNYFCKAFHVTNSTYVIGMEPIIDNKEVMHHIVIFGCYHSPDTKYLRTPTKCNMDSDSNCMSIVSLWTLGLTKDCEHPNTYIKLGPQSHFSYVMVQYHWNNPRMADNLYDESAVKLYTVSSPQQRQYPSGYFMTGSVYLDIPPEKPLVFQNFTLSKECTYAYMSERFFITKVYLHMHYSGLSGSVQQFRNGKFLRDLIPQTSLSYETPENFKLPDGTDFEPGDELKISCQYKTIGKKNTIYYGEATEDEMCYAFISYYPKNAVYHPSPSSFGPIDICKLALPKYGGRDYRARQIGECNVDEFFALFSNGSLRDRFEEFCKPTLPHCHHGCYDVVTEMNKHPCMSGWAFKYMYWATSIKLIPFDFNRIRLLTDLCQLEYQKNHFTLPSIANKPIFQTLLFGLLNVLACVLTQNSI